MPKKPAYGKSELGNTHVHESVRPKLSDCVFSATAYRPATGLHSLYIFICPMSKSIIINHLIQEIRVAVKIGDLLSEIYYERKKDKSPVGNIYKGKVLKVLPGMEAAFVDIGLPKAAFLYVDDIIVDDLDPTDDPTEESAEEEETDEDEETLPVKKSNKNLKISDLLSEGQEIIVQVVKGQIELKVPASHAASQLPEEILSSCRALTASASQNRFPTAENASKHKPNDVGFIIRTVAQRKQEEEFVLDIQYLKDHWEQIQDNFSSQSAPALLYEELTLTRKIMREMLSNDVDDIIIDNTREYEELKTYLNKYLPRYADKLKLYDRKQSIFDYYDINVQIDRALSRKVPLKSGGYLIIDQAEALTAIDINTGSFTGKDSHEQTIVQTNLEATVELVNQIKLRDLGGIIVIDYIDMESDENRQKVYQLLKSELKRDKAKTKISAISELGLVEMTRKRSQESLNQFLCTACPVCNGSGKIKSPETIVYEILRDVHEYTIIKPNVRHYAVTVHSDIKFQLENEARQELKNMERVFGGSIRLTAGRYFNLEEYEIMEATE
ncbi:hypothetical protein CHS0354_006862 [Potamilus streckersoni]|uniref:Ribonuclease G n=1 Tax=Potamilus streckersoni TaxID=2493646 RepID=A0AAE0WBS9_9BIVA|nr:hypothetical protein CHS0354_006862 [Potamilus streckersoni]